MGKPYNKDDIHVLHYVSEKPWVTGRIDPKDDKAIKSGLCHCAVSDSDWLLLLPLTFPTGAVR